jgi:Tol biopolymer transport system component
MPFIEPNERYLLFCRQSPEGFGKTDIYISFRNADGTWTKAINMGSKINTPEEEGFPSISPDGKYLFFCREGKFGFNPYWVSSKIIEELRPND